MQLVQIQIVSAQPFETVFAGSVNGLTSETAVTAPNMMPTRTADLAGKDHVVAALALAEPFSDDDLGVSVGFRTHIDGIHFGRIKKIDSVGERMVHLRKPLIAGVLLTPGHGAKANDRNVYSCITQRSVAHRRKVPEMKAGSDCSQVCNISASKPILVPRPCLRMP